jgi:hypothetical protein
MHSYATCNSGTSIVLHAEHHALFSQGCGAEQSTEPCLTRLRSTAVLSFEVVYGRSKLPDLVPV